MRVWLYGTECCHLCEQAEGLLGAAGAAADYVDIAGNPALLERYGMRIPVVRLDSGDELGWPFDAAMLGAFLASARANLSSSG